MTRNVAGCAEAIKEEFPNRDTFPGYCEFNKEILGWCHSNLPGTKFSTEQLVAALQIMLNLQMKVPGLEVQAKLHRLFNHIQDHDQLNVTSMTHQTEYLDYSDYYHAIYRSHAHRINNQKALQAEFDAKYEAKIEAAKR